MWARSLVCDLLEMERESRAVSSHVNAHTVHIYTAVAEIFPTNRFATKTPLYNIISKTSPPRGM